VPTRRQERINDLVHEELSLLVPGRLDDPRLSNVAITRVQVTQDLSTAKVFYTCDASDEECAEVPDALLQATGLLRSELADIGLRRLPQLVFARDREFERGQRVLDILEHLPHPEQDPTASAESDQDEE
jgi:ribosome-binding factor A